MVFLWFSYGFPMVSHPDHYHAPPLKNLPSHSYLGRPKVFQGPESLLPLAALGAGKDFASSACGWENGSDVGFISILYVCILI